MADKPSDTQTPDPNGSKEIVDNEDSSQMSTNAQGTVSPSTITSTSPISTKPSTMTSSPIKATTTNMDLLAEFDPLYVTPKPDGGSSSRKENPSVDSENPTSDDRKTLVKTPDLLTSTSPTRQPKIVNIPIEIECERVKSLSISSTSSSSNTGQQTAGSSSQLGTIPTQNPPHNIQMDLCQYPSQNRQPDLIPTQSNLEQAVEAEENVLPSTLTSSTLTTITNSESDSSGSLAQEYQLKWILWKGGERYPIVTQNSNGPCPLLAIINVLLLRKAITIPPMYEIITASQLMDFLCDSILNSVPSNIVDEERANYEQNFQDAMSVLPKLATGLDVNVKFSGVDQFEYTQESIIFDLLNIPLVHGWLIDPADRELYGIVANSSYNQLIDRIITSKGPNGDCCSPEMALAEEFLNSSASQLTVYGLFRLQHFIKEDELAIFFRNNHFITLYKHKNELYQLATDQGFLSEPNLVWESLNSIEGNTNFVDSNFNVVPPSATTSALVSATNFADLQPAALDMSSQVDQDHLLALSLAREQEMNLQPAAQAGLNSPTSQVSVISDEDFARKLQAEEEKAYQLERRQQQQIRQQNPNGNTTRPQNRMDSSTTSHHSRPHHQHNPHNPQQAPAPFVNPYMEGRTQRPNSPGNADLSSGRNPHRNSRQSPSPSDRSSKSNKCTIS